MGWTFGPLGGKTITEAVVAEYTWSNATSSTEVLAHSINVRKGVAYLAVKTTLPTGVSYVWAGVALIKHNPRDYYAFGIKDMDETVGPYETDCPARILDLLTPLEDIAKARGLEFRPDANDALWRKACRERIAKKAAQKPLKQGDLVTFDKPVRFGDGRERSSFKVWKDGRKLRFVSMSDGVTCRISERCLENAKVTYA